MTENLTEPSRLCALARELAEVVSHYQNKRHQKLQFNMYNNHNNDQDEIYVVSEDTSTGRTWTVVRVALARLSEETRSQLNLQIALCNQAMSGSTTLR